MRRTILLLALLLALVPIVAIAQPQPLRMQPAPGELLSRLPGSVDGWFSEGIDPNPQRTAIQVFELQDSGQTRRVDLDKTAVDTRDTSHVSVPLGDANRSGLYVILWRVTSTRDGKANTYCSVFFVGDAAVEQAKRQAIGMDCRGLTGLTFEPAIQATTIPERTPSPTPTPTPTRAPSVTPTGSPAATASPAETPVSAAESDGGGVPVWLAILLGGLAAALALVLGVLLGMNTKNRPPGGGPPRGPGPIVPGPRPPAAWPPVEPARPIDPEPSPPRTREPFGRPPPRPPVGG